jgi:osmoprotectant transport system ATP-binding protein
MLALEAVAKRYGSIEALAPTSLRLDPGATTVLIGPSGCGKSTVLRLIAGLIAPDQGRISFEDVPLTSENLPQLRRRMGYVIQEGGLFPHLSVRGNVCLMAHYLNWENARVEARLRELADLVQLAPALFERFPLELSGGQRQRVSLMRALMLDPELLLLDEPLGALDPMIRYELQQELKRIFQRLHKTVLMVTHDLAEAAFFGDTLVLMRAGSVVQHGTLDEIFAHPAEAFVENFIKAQRLPLRSIDQAEP